MNFRAYMSGVVGAMLGQGSAVAVRGAETPNSADTPENESLWRRLGQRRRDVSPSETWRGIEDGVRSWQRDGLAKRIISVVKFYAVGASELTVSASSKDEAVRVRVQEAIDLFWQDRRNRLHVRATEYYDALAATGELCLVLPSGAESRLTRVGFIDPAQIVSVVTDPDDAQRAVCVVRRRFGATSYAPVGYVAHPIPDSAGELPREFLTNAGAPIPADGANTIQVSMPGLSGGPGTAQNCVVGPPARYLGINRLPNQSRGISDLFVVFHLIEHVDRNTNAFAERMRNIAAYAWHMKFPGTTSQKEMDRQVGVARDELTRGAGGVLGTKGAVEVTALAPNLGTADWKTALDTLIGAVSTGTGIPPIYLTGEAGRISLGAAGELAGPFIALIESRQTLFRIFLEDLVLYALLRYPDLAALYAQDPRNLDMEWSFPQVTAKDAIRAISVLTGQLSALSVLQIGFGLKPEASIREASRLAQDYGLGLTQEDFDPARATGMPTGVPFPGVGDQQRNADGADTRSSGDTSDQRNGPDAAAA